MLVVEEKDWVLGEYEEVVTIDMDVPTLADKHGFTLISWDEDGLGEAKGQRFQNDMGAQYLICQYIQAPQPYNLKTHILCRTYNNDRTARAVADILPELVGALKDLGVAETDISWVREDFDHADLEDRLSEKMAVPLPPVFTP